MRHSFFYTSTERIKSLPFFKHLGLAFKLFSFFGGEPAGEQFSDRFSIRHYRFPYIKGQTCCLTGFTEFLHLFPINVCRVQTGKI